MDGDEQTASLPSPRLLLSCHSIPAFFPSTTISFFCILWDSTTVYASMHVWHSHFVPAPSCAVNGSVFH